MFGDSLDPQKTHENSYNYMALTAFTTPFTNYLQ